MFTIIAPHYNSPNMLLRQIEEWRHYTDVHVILIDDGGPNPVDPGILPENVSLYRVEVDIPWNNNGCRNLGAQLCDTEWMMMIDLDHILPTHCAEKINQGIAEGWISEKNWYELDRYIRHTPTQLHKHHDSPNLFLITKTMFWQTGGYDEDYCGSYGTDTSFREQRPKTHERLPHTIYLELHDRVVQDAKTRLSRDLARSKEIRARKGVCKAENPVRFPWHRVK